MARLKLFGGADHRRTHSRMEVGFSARLRTVSGMQEVRLLDLSRSGAQLVLSKPEKVRDGILTWLNFEAFGGAIRQSGDQVGLKFDQLIPLPWLIETREAAPSVVQIEELGDSAAAKDWVEGNIK